MKRKVVLIWIALLLFGIVPTSCDIFCNDSCGCGPLAAVKDFTIKNFGTENIVMNIESFNPESFYDRDQYFKVIKVVDFDLISEGIPNKKTGSMIPGAFACSPVPSFSVQSVTGLKIINKQETEIAENDLLTINQDISERFLVTDFPQFEGKPIAELLEEERKLELGESLLIQWKDDLQGGTLELVFDIIISLSDGQEFILENEVMRIK
jgi:hypothetical protein